MKEFTTGGSRITDIITSCTLIGMYGIVSILCWIKFILCIKSPKNDSTYKLLWFFVIINTVTFCKYLLSKNYMMP